MKSRLAFFLVILLALYFYLGLRLSPGIGWPVWIVVFMLLALLACYPLTWRRDHSDRTTSALRFFIHLDMGFLSFLASLVILRDLVFVPFLWLKPAWALAAFSPEGTASITVLALLTLAFGVFQATSGPRVRDVRIPIDGLPAELEGYRIAQISDLHVGPTIGQTYVERVVGIVEKLKPNITVLTGDIADGSADVFKDAIAPLRSLRNSGETFYVPGNHEYYWNGPRWIREFEALGIEALLNSRKVLRFGGHDVLVAGVVDPAARIASPGLKPDATAALGPPNNSKLKILLSHHPGIARVAAELGFHLQLSGHTHAGQFFPWTLVVRRVHEFAHGLKSCGKMWVYVNPGTGSWGPPIRLGTSTEVTLLRLSRA